MPDVKEAKDTTTELAPRRSSLPLVPTNMDEAWRFSEALSKSNLLPDHYQGKPANILAAFFMAADLGISAMQAMREIYVVKGKPVASSALKTALVRQSSQCMSWEYVEQMSHKGQSATFRTQRRGDAKPTTFTFTLEEAKRAGLYPGKDDSAWSKWTDNMLRARAASFLADLVYPDVVKGLRTGEEMDEVVEQEVKGERVFESTFAPPAPSKPVQEVTPEPDEPPKAQAASGPPDPVDVLLSELTMVERTADIDALSRRAQELLPKGHPRRQEVGNALNAARAKVKQ